MLPPPETQKKMPPSLAAYCSAAGNFYNGSDGVSAYTRYARIPMSKAASAIMERCMANAFQFVAMGQSRAIFVTIFCCRIDPSQIAGEAVV
jgi:hypothetical protein